MQNNSKRQSAICPACKRDFSFYPSRSTRFCSHACYKSEAATVIRFWDYCNKTESCWLWTASVINTGYGCFRVHRKTILAHRFSYELAFGTIPNGLFVCHRCDTPKCVLPDHLFLGTVADNIQDCINKGRRGDHGTPVRGERNPASKLTERDVRIIRERRACGERRKLVAAEFMVSESLINQICSGTVWSHVV